MAPKSGMNYALPATNDAPRICVTLSIPGDQDTISNFIGALNTLALWYNYRSDSAKRGKNIAAVWKTIVENIDFSDCKIAPPIIITEEIEDMGIRVDCDCRVWVTCCDGTEVELATVGMVDRSNQPGTGTRPAPGQSTCYQRTLSARDSWLLPFSVNTGDVLTVSDLAGAWTNNGIAWTCPDGTPFFGGACVGSRYHVAGDPSGSLFHGQLCYLIAGVYYSATDGAFTVPSGVANAQVLLVGNFEQNFSCAGDIVFKICAENGATPPTATWCYAMDFTASDFGWSIYTSGGHTYAVWSPGLGWQGSPDSGQDALIITMSGLSATPFTQLTLTLSEDFSGPNPYIQLLSADGSITYGEVLGDQTTTVVIPLSGSPVDLQLYMDLYVGGTDKWSGYLVSAVFEGTGTSPFGASNC